MKPYPVAINPEFVPRLEDALQQLNIKPMACTKSEVTGEDGNSEVSILVSETWLSLNRAHIKTSSLVINRLV